MTSIFCSYTRCASDTFARTTETLPILKLPRSFPKCDESDDRMTNTGSGNRSKLHHQEIPATIRFHPASQSWRSRSCRSLPFAGFGGCVWQPRILVQSNDHPENPKESQVGMKNWKHQAPNDHHEYFHLNWSWSILNLLTFHWIFKEWWNNLPFHHLSRPCPVDVLEDLGDSRCQSTDELSYLATTQGHCHDSLVVDSMPCHISFTHLLKIQKSTPWKIHQPFWTPQKK